jgi:hypothetical protein
VVLDTTACRLRAIVALLFTVFQSIMLLITTVPVDFICALVTGLLSLVIAIAATAVTFAPDSTTATSVLDAAATAGVVIGIVGVISMASAFVRFVVSFTHRVYYRRHELEKMGVVLGPGNDDYDELEEDDALDMGLREEASSSASDSTAGVEEGEDVGGVMKGPPKQAGVTEQEPIRCPLRETQNMAEDRELGLEDYYGRNLDGHPCGSVRWGDGGGGGGGHPVPPETPLGPPTPSLIHHSTRHPN